MLLGRGLSGGPVCGPVCVGISQRASILVTKLQGLLKNHVLCGCKKILQKNLTVTETTWLCWIFPICFFVFFAEDLVNLHPTHRANKKLVLDPVEHVWSNLQKSSQLKGELHKQKWNHHQQVDASEIKQTPTFYHVFIPTTTNWFNASLAWFGIEFFSPKNIEIATTNPTHTCQGIIYHL